MGLSKKIMAIILTFFLMLSVFTNVYADDMSATVTLSMEEASQYKVGEEIILNVSIDVVGFSGIRIFYADVKYDKNVLEYEGIEGLKDGWTITNQKDCVYIKRSDFTNEKGQLCKLKFKVLKNDIDTEVKLEAVNATGTRGEVHYLYGNVNEPSISFKGQAAKPDDTKPDDTKPDDTKPDDTKPDDTKPDDTKPDDTKPDDTKPDDTKPDDTKPDDTKPDDTKPDDTKPDDTKPDDTKPDDTKPDDTKPDDTKPDNTKPNNTQSTQNQKPTNNTGKDDTTSQNKIPQTGSLIFEFIFMPIAIGIAIFLLIKYRKISKDIR